MILDMDGDKKKMGMNQMKTIQDLRMELFASIKNLGLRVQSAEVTMRTSIQSLQDPKPANEVAKESLSQRMTDLSTLISNFAQQSRAVASEQAILKNLRFNVMQLRRSTMVDAHQNTFDWVFETKPSPENKTLAFKDWLESQSGVYWIVGKAGSGKSTLMKFLCKDGRTKKFLQNWSGGRKLVMAQFFFWNAGTAIQKSQEGFLQSLLYEVLNQCPELVSAKFVLPGDQTTHTMVMSQTYGQRLIFLRFSIFCYSMTKFLPSSASLSMVSMSMMGIMSSSTTFLNRWPVSIDLKLCVSSRPWYIFKDTFGQEMKAAGAYQR